MEILKIFKGGFINKEPVIGNDSINSQIQDNITNITFNKDEYIFNEKLKVKLNYELILKNIKSKIDESILELQLKNKEITDFLSANPDTEDEILLEKTKDEFKVLIIKKDKNSDDESRIRVLKELIERLDTEIVKQKKNKKKSFETNSKEIKRLGQQKSTIDSYLLKISEGIAKYKLTYETLRRQNPFAHMKQGYVFDPSVIDDKQLKQLYNTYSEEEHRKIRLVLNDDYKKVFNNIVPIYLDSDGDIFTFLKGDDKTSKYLIVEYSNRKYYEIFKNFTIWEGEINIYELLPNFTVKFLSKNTFQPAYLKDHSQIIYKKSGYINFGGKKYNNKLIEGNLVTDLKFVEIINYYSKFLGNTFDKWLSHFGSWHRGTETVGLRQFHYHYDVNILQCFTIDNSFRIYYNIFISISDAEINDKLNEISISSLSEEEITEFKTLFAKNLSFENSVYAFIHTLDNLNKKQKINTEEAPYIILYKYFKLIEDSLDKLEAQIVYTIMNSSFSKLEYNDKLIYGYNYLKINSLYRLTMDTDKSWPYEERFFDNIKKLNQFMKLNKNQLDLAFCIDFFEELYDLKRFMILTPGNQYVITLIWFLFLRQLENNPLIKKLTNLEIEFGTLLKKDFSNEFDFEPIVEKFYKSLLNSSSLLQGYTEIKYNNRHVYRTARNPRTNEMDINIPYCGEITLLNFFMILIYDKKTKELKSSYLPESTLQSLKDLFSRYKNIKDLDTKESLIEYYNIIEHINYGIVHPWDNEPSLQIYKRASKTYHNNRFDRGLEYRLTYFNLCRAASYLLNLDGDLELRTLERNGVDENTLKKIIEKFKNPNITQILSSYQIVSGITSRESFYNGEPINVIISNVNFSLAQGHSFPTIQVEYNDKIKEILSGMHTFYDYKWSDGGLNILESITISILKNQYIYSEIYFPEIDVKDSIKFFSILKEFTENYHIPKKLIKNFIIEYNEEVLDYIFNNFIIVDKDKWLLYFKFIIRKFNPIKKIKEMLPIFLKNAILKINKITGAKIISNNVIELFLKKLKKEEYIQIEEFIDISLIKNKLYNIVDIDLFKYLTRDISIFNKHNIKNYIKPHLDEIINPNDKLVRKLNYEFLNLFDKTIFEYKIVYLSLYYFGIKKNNFDFIKFLISKNVDLPDDIFDYKESYNIDNLYKTNRMQYSYQNIFIYIFNKKMYDLIINYITSRGQDLKFITSDTGKMIILYNCIVNFIDTMIKFEEKQNILDLVVELIDVFKSDLDKQKFFKRYFDIDKIRKCEVLLLVKNFKKYLNESVIAKIFLFEPPKFDCKDLYIKICDENYNDFKSIYLNHIELVQESYKHYFIVHKPDETDFIASEHLTIYFPLILDLLSIGKIELDDFIITFRLEKYYIDLLILFLRKEENQKFFFTKDSNFIMKYLELGKGRFGGDVDTDSYSPEEQSQFIRFFGFLLKNTFKSVLYIHCSFFIDKQKFKDYLVNFIKDILAPNKEGVEELKLENYNFAFKIVDLILEKNKEYVLSLDPKMRKDASFIDEKVVNGIILHLLKTRFNMDTIPETNLILNRIIKKFDPYYNKYIKYKNKYLKLTSIR
jgi:hypothetical protein